MVILKNKLVGQKLRQKNSTCFILIICLRAALHDHHLSLSSK